MKNNLRKSGRAASRSRKAKAEQSRLGHASPAGPGSCETGNAHEPGVSVLLSVDGKSEKLTKDEQIHALKWGLDNSRSEIVQMIDLLAKVHAATVDMLRFYDRAVGNVIDDSGYSVADMRRLEEIRKLVEL